MKLHAQDVYIIGLALHQRLLNKKVHGAMSRSPQEFENIWKEAIAEVEALVKTRQIDLYGNTIQDIHSAIDWTFVQWDDEKHPSVRKNNEPSNPT